MLNGDVRSPSLFSHPFADLIITSPPYNVGVDYDGISDSLPYDEYLAFSETWMSNCFKWAKSECRFCLNVPVQANKDGYHALSADLTSIAQAIGWEFRLHITWNKNTISNRFAWGSHGSASSPCINTPVEAIVVFFKDAWPKSGVKNDDITDKEFNAWTNGLWTIAPERKSVIGHPAPFPREIPRRCIKIFSYVGDTVFDPFVGSGTTLIEAHVNNRIGIGLDRSRKFCELARQRIISECSFEGMGA